MVPTITTTREQRAQVLLAEASPANGQTRSDEGRLVPALPFFQRNLDAVDVTALFLGRSTRPCATVQWLLYHRCGSSWNPPLSDQNRSLPGDAHRRASQPWSKTSMRVRSSPPHRQACNRPSDQRPECPLFISSGTSLVELPSLTRTLTGLFRHNRRPQPTCRLRPQPIVLENTSSIPVCHLMAVAQGCYDSRCALSCTATLLRSAFETGQSCSAF
jgi:hypothetical protein